MGTMNAIGIVLVILAAIALAAAKPIIYIFYNRHLENIFRVWAQKQGYSVVQFSMDSSVGFTALFEMLLSDIMLLWRLLFRTGAIRYATVIDEEGGQIRGYVAISGNMKEPNVKWTGQA